MEHTTTMTSFEPFPALDSAPTSPQHAHSVTDDMISPTAAPSDSPDTFHLEYEGPLYTEINIPLPRLPRHYAASTCPSAPTSTHPATSSAPASAPAPAIPPKSRARSVTLSSLSPFRHRRSSSSSSASTSTTTSQHSQEWPRVRRQVVKSREVNAMMDLGHQSKRGRSGTVDALAVVPAVLVLSAELFTPGVEGRGRDGAVGRWEEGIR